ncbi:collagen alpha-3(V) chain [Platysternon megacephalum]|uniref:Collagen alpha-3(V) chain n=1 Tax=Platysternon megacephalum TaxID=55544 RepID=A0A4D9DNT2_9SAUR|nr:collagen alpha-3(V) chain [Platysternon megacephalum]
MRMRGGYGDGGGPQQVRGAQRGMQTQAGGYEVTVSRIRTGPCGVQMTHGRRAPAVSLPSLCVCVCVCVCERERERERGMIARGRGEEDRAGPWCHAGQC